MSFRSMRYEVSPVSGCLTPSEQQAIRAQEHVVRPLLAWLKKREAAILYEEDKQGTFNESAEGHLHVRAFKGARWDCQDIITQIEDVLKQKDGE